MKRLLVWAGIGTFLVCYLLFAFYPALPRSALGWVALVCLGLPLWVFLERLGEIILASRLFSKMSSTARILTAVPAVIALVVISIVLVHYLQQAILAI